MKSYFGKCPGKFALDLTHQDKIHNLHKQSLCGGNDRVYWMRLCSLEITSEPADVSVSDDSDTVFGQNYKLSPLTWFIYAGLVRRLKPLYFSFLRKHFEFKDTSFVEYISTVGTERSHWGHCSISRSLNGSTTACTRSGEIVSSLCCCLLICTLTSCWHILLSSGKASYGP